jgi:deoxyadenosine/deoxycytidine kinase
MIIYLNANLDTCRVRICRRDRLTEKDDYDVEYLETLHYLHNFAFKNQENVLELDWNEDFTENEIKQKIPSIFKEIKDKWMM